MHLAATGPLVVDPHLLG